MKEEVCYGVVPLKKTLKGYDILLLKHQKGSYWGFPKGHQNPNEPPRKAALRELKEETNLECVKDFDQIFSEEYTFTRDNQTVHKLVFYFLMECSGEVQIQKEEIADAKWMSFEEAKNLLNFKGALSILKQVAQFLSIS
jgi:ADP-ribose pyrophosphatase YjhB (NUDIX family)